MRGGEGGGAGMRGGADRLDPKGGGGDCGRRGEGG